MKAKAYVDLYYLPHCILFNYLSLIGRIFMHGATSQDCFVRPPVSMCVSMYLCNALYHSANKSHRPLNKQ